MTVLPDENMYTSAPDRIGHTVHGLVSIKLPNRLEEFEPHSLKYRSLEYLEIPASVTKYNYSCISGGNFKMDLVHVLNPEPVSFQENVGILNDAYDYRSTTTLLVPKGSKEKYLAHPNWQGFREIVETEEPSDARFVDVGNARYLLVHGFASLSGFYQSSSYGVFQDDIEVDGIPVIYINSGARFPQLVYYECSKPLDHYLCWIEEVVTPFLELARPPKMEIFQMYVPGAFDADGFGIHNLNLNLMKCGDIT